MKLPSQEKTLGPPPITLIKVVRDGCYTYRMASIDRTQDAFFDEWCYQLSRKKADTTVKNYSIYVGVLLGFIQQVAYQNSGLTTMMLAQALDNFESFLVFGTASDISMVRKAARVLGDRNLKGRSVSVALAAANNFIDASERFRLSMIELESLGYISTSQLSGFSLAQTFGIESPTRVRAAIKSQSWLAGCLAGGVRRIKKKGLAPTSKPSEMAYTDQYGGDEKAFPIDKCKDFINSATCSRDRVLWSGLAACGGRISELLTMMKSDIRTFNDVKLNKVYIVDPDTRRSELNRFISERQINSLPHKGRAQPDTFLIEPFASMFWIAFRDYEREMKESNFLVPLTHDFFITSLVDGSPMHNGYQALLERFKDVALKITGKPYAFHSLRHMYGYYLVNHIPIPQADGSLKYGFPLATVQKLMGHKDINSTKRYARQDAHLLEATLAAANLARLTFGPKSVIETRIAFFQQQINQLKRIALEQA